MTTVCVNVAEKHFATCKVLHEGKLFITRVFDTQEILSTLPRWGHDEQAPVRAPDMLTCRQFDGSDNRIMYKI